MNENLYSLFRSRFPKDPSGACLMSPDGATLSYGDLDVASARMAGCLAGLGVGRGDRVAVQVEKSPLAVVLYLACLRIGAVYLPLNTAYTADEVAYFLGDAKPVLAVCGPKQMPALQQVAAARGVRHLLTMDAEGGGTLHDAWETAVPREEIETVTGGDLAAILYTSGTTGRSKGAMLSHDNLASNARVLHEYWGWQPGDVLLHALPIFHVHGLFVAIHCALLNGSPMWFLPRFDADEVIRLLPRSTVLMGVPTFYTRLLDHAAFDRDVCRNMRLFISGSAPLLEETFRAFEARTGLRILERYGMTEAGMITSNPLDGERIAGTVGFPLPGVQARVVDEDGAAITDGSPGVLEITGPNVFKGYWEMPEKTAAEFRPDGYFITGDIATMGADGRIAIVGRAKDLIITGGYNVYPKEIELAIDMIPGVRESAVFGVPHPDFGEAVTAAVIRDGSAALEEAAVVASLEGRLARFKQPKRVFFIDALPRNSMGKVQKNVLRQRYAGTFTVGSERD